MKLNLKVLPNYKYYIMENRIFMNQVNVYKIFSIINVPRLPCETGIQTLPVGRKL